VRGAALPKAAVLDYDRGIRVVGKKVLTMKTIPAGTFKARCLAIMDEVRVGREGVLITNHGKPVAKLVPADEEADEIYNFLRGKGETTGDIIAPAITNWGRFR
jgi:prevent-host-death family protein